MSKRRDYFAGVPLTVIPPDEWRRRPELFLGREHRSWSRVVLERCLAEVGAPLRSWGAAVLSIERGHVRWVDDSPSAVSPLGVFWREACTSLDLQSGAAGMEAKLVLDPVITPTWHPEELLHIVRRCSARSGGARVRVEVEGADLQIVSSSWRDYTSGGAHVLSFRSGEVGDFAVDLAVVDGPADLVVEVLEQGVPRGVWPELMRFCQQRQGRWSVRVVIRTEMPHDPQMRESEAVAALQVVFETIGDVD